MSTNRREYAYQAALFICLILLVVIGSYKFVYPPLSQVTDDLEEALKDCHECLEIIENIDASIYNADMMVPVPGNFFDKYCYDMDSIGEFLDTRIKEIKANLIDALSLLHKVSYRAS